MMVLGTLLFLALVTLSHIKRGLFKNEEPLGAKFIEGTQKALILGVLLGGLSLSSFGAADKGDWVWKDLLSLFPALVFLLVFIFVLGRRHNGEN